MALTPRKSTPAPATVEDTALETASVAVLEIEPESAARELPEKFNAKSGDPRFARMATVVTKSGAHIKVEVHGTAKQWEFFNGSSIEGRRVHTKAFPEGTTGEWRFSPVANLAPVLGESLF